MFKDHPKGLLGAALANMGERFGFYIMMAILSLFISAKFGLSVAQTGMVYSTFYAAIYLLSLVGGIIADRTQRYKQTIMWGIILMAVGYVLIGIPTPTPVPSVPVYLTITCVGLFVIAFGNGLFKGNLQAVVGQLYDDPRYSDKRESGFQIFYMFINVGAIFAPLIAVGVRNWWLKTNGFNYDAALPERCHELINGSISADGMSGLQTMANGAMVDGGTVTNLQEFANQYLDVFNKGFQFAFLTAVVMMVVSLLIYFFNYKKLPDPSKKATTALAGISHEEVKMAASEVEQRLLALAAVFGVVIFFWMSFHQNGYSLSYFARDYINLEAIKVDLGFTQIIGAEIFQSVNPFFVVTLTFPVMWLFAFLKKIKKNPSTPMKIGIGMGIAGLAYLYLFFMSMGLPDSADLEAAAGFEKLTPWVMIVLYLLLTVAELFISPLGLAFVSKVAPPHLQGVMQGAWLGATAVGNQLLFIGGLLYQDTSLTTTWIFFVCACSVSMIAMFSMVKWLERVTADKPAIEKM